MATKTYVSEVRVLRGTSLVVAWGRCWPVTASGTNQAIGGLGDTFSGYVVKVLAGQSLTVLARVGAAASATPGTSSCTTRAAGRAGTTSTSRSELAATTRTCSCSERRRDGETRHHTRHAQHGALQGPWLRPRTLRTRPHL